MELIQAAAPAIRDIGIYDIDTWSGGFNLLYTEIKNIIFDENLKLNKNLVSVIQELEQESVCGSDVKMLAVSLSRIAALLVFIKIATEKLK